MEKITTPQSQEEPCCVALPLFPKVRWQGPTSPPWASIDEAEEGTKQHSTREEATTRPLEPERLFTPFTNPKYSFCPFCVTLSSPFFPIVEPLFFERAMAGGKCQIMFLSCIRHLRFSWHCLCAVGHNTPGMCKPERPVRKTQWACPFVNEPLFFRSLCWVPSRETSRRRVAQPRHITHVVLQFSLPFFCLVFAWQKPAFEGPPPPHLSQHTKQACGASQNDLGQNSWDNSSRPETQGRLVRRPIALSLGLPPALRPLPPSLTHKTVRDGHAGTLLWPAVEVMALFSNAMPTPPIS